MEILGDVTKIRYSVLHNKTVNQANKLTYCRCYDKEQQGQPIQ